MNPEDNNLHVLFFVCLFVLLIIIIIVVVVVGIVVASTNGCTLAQGLTI